VSGLLQRKSSVGTLPVSEPGDTSERQADRVADEVMGSQTTSESGQQNRTASSVSSGAARGTLHDLGSGAPLDPATRSSFEPGFGADFSGVRVHSDEKAARSARDLNARAFTVGSDVVFAEGEYQPHTSAGKHLLAHELAHVVQQGAGSVMVQRAVALTDDDYKSLAAQLHDAIYGLGTDEEAIFVALQKLEKDATAIAKLIKVYKDEYSNADLEADIRGDMSGSELTLALELMGIKDDQKAPDIVGTVPTTDDEYKAVAKKLHSAMNQVGTEEEEIYGLLMPFNRDETKLTKLKTIYQSELSGGLTGKGLEADIKDEMSSDELAYALFLLNAPTPVGPSTGATVTTPGTEAHTGKVGGGDVSVHTGGEFTQIKTGRQIKEGFTIGYKGALASESNWLQFIWREIVVEHPDKGTYHLTGPMTHSKNQYSLTTDPDKPNYSTDSASADSPFYAAAFLDNRTADATTIFDEPTPIKSRVQAAFTDGATKVTSRAIFNTFLIRDYKTLYHVQLQVEWVFTSATVPPNVQTLKSAGKVDSLPSPMKEKLVEQYPKFEYIQ
jgi:hypothetical protein